MLESQVQFFPATGQSLLSVLPYSRRVYFLHENDIFTIFRHSAIHWDLPCNFKLSNICNNCMMISTHAPVPLKSEHASQNMASDIPFLIWPDLIWCDHNYLLTLSYLQKVLRFNTCFQYTPTLSYSWKAANFLWIQSLRILPFLSWIVNSTRCNENRTGCPKS